MLGRLAYRLASRGGGHVVTCLILKDGLDDHCRFSQLSSFFLQPATFGNGTLRRGRSLHKGCVAGLIKGGKADRPI